MIKNPVMFTVELATVVMLAVTIYQVSTGDKAEGALWYNMVVFLILLITVLFANFAEALAEARYQALTEAQQIANEEYMHGTVVNVARRIRELKDAEGEK